MFLAVSLSSPPLNTLFLVSFHTCELITQLDGGYGLWFLPCRKDASQMLEREAAPPWLTPSPVQYHKQICHQSYLTCICIHYCHSSAVEVSYPAIFEKVGTGYVATNGQRKMWSICKPNKVLTLSCPCSCHQVYGKLFFLSIKKKKSEFKTLSV